jgi:hypothetical protein
VWTTRAELLFGDRVVLGRELAKSSTPLEVTVPWPRFSYPGGVHPVIFRLTDNRGLTTTQRLGSVELADGARSAFTVSRDLIEEGSRLPMITGSFTAYPGTTIREWRVQVDDRVVASGSCTGDTGCPNQVPVSVRWPGDEDFRHVGSHSVLVTADDDLGVHHARLFHVTAVPATRTKLTVSDTRVSRGAMVKVKASIKDSLNRAVRGATVRFQRRPAGTRSWTTIATRLSDRRGVATLSVKMRRTVDVRAIVLAKPARWGGSRTRAARVRVARQP